MLLETLEHKGIQRSMFRPHAASQYLYGFTILILRSDGVKEGKISSRSSSDLELLVNKERASMARKAGNHCAQCD